MGKLPGAARIKLQLVERVVDLPGMDGGTAEEAAALEADVDWGGAAWGGRYQEVLSGLHINDITVKGYFVIRHVLAGDRLSAQAYDGR